MTTIRSNEQAQRTEAAADPQILRQELVKRGAVELPLAQFPISWESWNRLAALAEELPYEEIVEGDAGDKHVVWVGRFINDVEEPTYLHESSPEVAELLTAPELMDFYRALLGEERLCIRRCQVNLLREGGYVGLHIDQDANPDYLVAVILHLSDSYSGGEYVVQSPDGEELRFKPKAPAVLFSRGDIPHEVAPVAGGERKTLVFFLSTNFGRTGKKRSPATATSRKLDSPQN